MLNNTHSMRAFLAKPQQFKATFHSKLGHNCDRQNRLLMWHIQPHKWELKSQSRYDIAQITTPACESQAATPAVHFLIIHFVAFQATRFPRVYTRQDCRLQQRRLVQTRPQVVLIFACGLLLNVKSIRVVVCLRLGCALCQVHSSPHGAPIDSVILASTTLSTVLRSEK